MAFPERKVKVLSYFLDLFSKYKQIIVVDLINISTKQIVNTRMALRKTGGVILVGKNNLANLAIRILSSETPLKGELLELQKKYPTRPELKNLAPLIKNKVGYVLSDLSYLEMKTIIESEKVKTAAKQGMVAPSSIVIPAGPTNVDPGKVIEFQRLGIQTKVNKGALEITRDFNLCKKGEIVSATVSAMCHLLNIIPFEFSMSLNSVYINGLIIPQSVIQLDTTEMISSIAENVKAVTAVSLEAGLTNALSLPHVVRNTFQNILAIGLSSNLKFKELDALTAASQVQAAPVAAKAAKKEEPKKEEAPVAEEADMDMGDLFG